MYVVTVVFDAVSGRADALEDALIAQAENSLREEAGCLRFDVARDAAKPGRFFLYEIYENESAFDAHLQTPHFLDFSEKTAEMVANKTVDRWAMVRATG
ncbi:MAG: putative quinol monooxygenase [Rhodomicrobiaceae bacterium]